MSVAVAKLVKSFGEARFTETLDEFRYPKIISLP